MTRYIYASVTRITDLSSEAFTTEHRDRSLW